MRIWVCGVRGSTPATGSEFVRYGGNTSCVVVAHDRERPSLILDAGTGIRRASDLFKESSDLFEGQPFEGAIVLGHLHWDHTQGLPFFRAGNTSRSRVDLYAPAQGDTKMVLARSMSPPHFPITPDQLLGSWSFTALEPGKSDIAGFSILALEIPHSPGRTYGYRISDGGASFAYLSDHCPTNLGPGQLGLGQLHDAALTLSDGCDLLFHDAQYTDEELSERAHFGHASCGYAVDLAVATKTKRLLLFHHDPARSDEQIDAIVASYGEAKVPVSAAAEGMVIDLP